MLRKQPPHPCSSIPQTLGPSSVPRSWAIGAEKCQELKKRAATEDIKRHVSGSFGRLWGLSQIQEFVVKGLRVGSQLSEE